MEWLKMGMEAMKMYQGTRDEELRRAYAERDHFKRKANNLQNKVHQPNQFKKNNGQGGQWNGTGNKSYPAKGDQNGAGRGKPNSFDDRKLGPSHPGQNGNNKHRPNGTKVSTNVHVHVHTCNTTTRCNNKGSGRGNARQAK